MVRLSDSNGVPQFAQANDHAVVSASSVQECATPIQSSQRRHSTRNWQRSTPRKPAVDLRDPTSAGLRILGIGVPAGPMQDTASTDSRRPESWNLVADCFIFRGRGPVQTWPSRMDGQRKSTLPIKPWPRRGLRITHCWASNSERHIFTFPSSPKQAYSWQTPAVAVCAVSKTPQMGACCFCCSHWQCRKAVCAPCCSTVQRFGQTCAGSSLSHHPHAASISGGPCPPRHKNDRTTQDQIASDALLRYRKYSRC